MNEATPSVPSDHGETPAGDRAVLPSDLTGTLVGDYQILRRLGRGGMADVYVAQQKSLARQVAIKVLRPDLARDANYVERFRREARAAAKLTHPNIVQVYEVGQWSGRHYIVQEFVDGKNLRQHLDRSGPLSVDEAVMVLLGVSEALQAAAESGITHRDIKPENIMLSSRGAVKVADFGLARVSGTEGSSDLTQVGLTMGTPRYMSPEQVQGKPVDVRSDLYSLGVSMYHLLSGRPPFEADDPLAMAVKHLHETPPPLAVARPTGDLPDWLPPVIDRLLAKSPADRFASPAELAQVIRRGLLQEADNDSDTVTATSLSGTLALQRVMHSQAALDSRWQGWRRWLWLLLPVAGLLLGVLLAARRPAPSVAAILSPSNASVQELETPAEQFLEAARLDSAQAWRAVWQYHSPEDSPENAQYAIKAKLQLARVYREEGEPELAVHVLEKLLEDNDLETFYRALALADLVTTLEQQGLKTRADAVRGELRGVYLKLDENPTRRDQFDRVVRERDPGLIERLQIE